MSRRRCRPDPCLSAAIRQVRRSGRVDRAVGVAITQMRFAASWGETPQSIGAALGLSELDRPATWEQAIWRAADAWSDMHAAREVIPAAR